MSNNKKVGIVPVNQCQLNIILDAVPFVLAVRSGLNVETRLTGIWGQVDLSPLQNDCISPLLLRVG